MPEAIAAAILVGGGRTAVSWHDDVIDSGGALVRVVLGVAHGGHAAVLVLAGDLPFVTGALVRTLAAIGGEDTVVPRTAGGWHPLCATYRRHVAPALKRRLDTGLWRITHALPEMRLRELTVNELGGWIPPACC